MKEERVAECLVSWGRWFQMWGAKVRESAKAMGFEVEELEFEHACV